MDYPAACALVERYVDRSNAQLITYWDGEVKSEVVIFDEYTQEKACGWVFFVHNVVYRETRDVLDMGSEVAR
ncbi:hypothetical protein [Deinococcus sp.]|uniref:hypothetical protein n=1 Tax=Deinococcus sp. TaxID=47478 RepID=UPI002869D4A0|nr:hypothetical protein [Deinococcus sp.]